MLSFGFKGGFSTSFHDRKRKRFSAFLTSSRSSKQDITEIYDTFGGHIRSALIFFNEELIIKNLYRNGEIPALSERERECLLWVSAGHTTQQIADQLSLADRTVNEYISKATRKLHASNRAHACARSILLSLISP
ncbi:hypothetical protein AB433_02775 [Croceicoccus naphthovorans]|uniref:HTH luxR-type domain-containing protein n=2 Tax=Croceicoccus naphthovorans TaxID=1348774 RepID=A0A0G3XC71_9SPHN|nr:hypothetical protein AB433_02775 [Croceicoccus naphthovorans]